MSDVAMKPCLSQASIMILILLFASFVPQQAVSKTIPITENIVVNKARNYVLRALPQLKEYLGNNPQVIDLGVDGALRLRIIKVVWNSSRGIYIEVSEVLINSSWIPYYLYVELNPSNASLAEELSNKSASMITSLKNRYQEIANKVTQEGFRIIGFALYINSTPIGILRPGPYIDVARLYWGVRFEGPISSYALLNDYPIIKYFLSKFGYTKSLTINDALKELNKVALTHLNVSDVMEYLLVVNGSLKKAYVAYLNPYELGIVLSDNGELIYPGNYTSLTKSSSQNTGGWRYSTLMSYIVYFVVALVAILALFFMWVKLRKI